MTSTTPAKKPLTSVYADCMAFIADHPTAVLATLSTKNDDLTPEPEVSYAPVLVDNHHYYIYISGLASHTQNLINTPKASVMFIEDEAQAETLFARKRATVKVSAQAISRGTDTWESTLDKMAEKFGDMIAVIKPLADFQLFELTPLSINFVRGFAQAYTLTGAELDEVTHRRGSHGKSESIND